MNLVWPSLTPGFSLITFSWSFPLALELGRLGVARMASKRSWGPPSTLCPDVCGSGGHKSYRNNGATHDRLLLARSEMSRWNPTSVSSVRQAGSGAQNQPFVLFIPLLLFTKVPCCSPAPKASLAFLMKNAAVHLFSNSLHWFSGLFFLPSMYKEWWVAECGIH